MDWIIGAGMRLAKLLILICALPVLACPASADEPPDAKAELAAAVSLLKASHMNRGKIDWAATEIQAGQMLGDKTTAADAYPAIRYVITQLGEKHTTLLTADAVNAMLTGRQVGNVRPPDVIPPEGYELAGKIGLIVLKSYLGSPADSVNYAAAARSALRKFDKDKICGFIVDLRSGGGGNMYPMMNGLDALLGDEPYGYWLGENTQTPWQGASGKFLAVGEAAPDKRQQARQGKAPVAVLIDRDTGSSGEFTAMAFEGRPDTRFFGEPTAGFVTVNSSQKLPDGAMINISVGWAADRQHRPYREPIAPDQATPRGQATFDAAIAWLKTQPCGG